MITDRIDNITKIPEGFLKTILPAPKSVKIELSPRCDYRCGFCALRTRKDQPVEDMDFSLFKRITSEMAESGVKEIGLFFLGESMMNPELLYRAVLWCKNKLQIPYVFLTTNGSRAEPELINMIMSAGLDSLKFSVNASDAEQFEKIMGVPSVLFDRALYNIKESRRIRDENNYPCNIYASSIMYEGDQLKRMKSLLNEKVLPYVDEHYWLPLYSMGSFATKREEELGYKPIAGNQGRLGALRDPLPCWSAFTEGHVRADGGLSACCFDAGGEWVMADLNKKSFMEAWNSDKFQSLRSAHLKRNINNTICNNCIAYQ